MWRKRTELGHGKKWTLPGHLLAIPQTPGYYRLLMQLYREMGKHLDALLCSSLDAGLGETAEDTVQVRHSSSEGEGFQGPHDYIMEARLLKHQRSSQAACGDLLRFSYASDSSRVGHLGILNGIGVLPNNVAFSLAPQAHSMYDMCPCLQLYVHSCWRQAGNEPASWSELDPPKA